MAKTRKQRGQLGGTLFGFLAGLVLGLGIAVVVALFVTRAPVPFVKKAHRPPGSCDPASAPIIRNRNPARPAASRPRYSRSSRTHSTVILT